MQYYPTGLLLPPLHEPFPRQFQSDLGRTSWRVLERHKARGERHIANTKDAYK